MSNEINNILTKSEFLLYCEAPRHLWAKRNGRIEQCLSDFDKHLIKEGYITEGLAKDYLVTVLMPNNPRSELIWQMTFVEDAFEARIDALLYKPETDTYDLYEIKSATNLDKEHLYDFAFQTLILEGQVSVDHFFLLHLNKEYIRRGELDLAQLFIAEDVTDAIIAMQPEIEKLCQEALQAAKVSDPGTLDHCFNPKNCPCPDICHPELPEFSIYEVPNLRQKKKAALLEMEIRQAQDIPATFELNEKQRLVVERARTNTEYVDKNRLRFITQGFHFPLWFLDYETCISAIPRFDGYHPQQQVVFQYSLHCLEDPDGELRHMGCISLSDGDPSMSLLEHLRSDLGASGTVIVWNKAFEMTMNKEMANLHPEYADFLNALNNRICDLGEIINKGIYLHPGCKGSWSIKNVLPVMVPELTYEGMAINKGDQASMAWWNITFGGINEEEKESFIEGLEKYCELDTLAMVEIYRKLQSLV